MLEQVLVVRVGPYVFGAPVSAVTEILAEPRVTPIPRTSPLVAGVAIVRGQPLMVLTLRPVLQLESAPVGMALRWGGHRGSFLLAVDQVKSLWTPGIPLPSESWRALIPPLVAGWIRAGYPWSDDWLFLWSDDLLDRVQEVLIAESMSRI